VFTYDLAFILAFCSKILQGDKTSTWVIARFSRMPMKICHPVKFALDLQISCSPQWWQLPNRTCSIVWQTTARTLQIVLSLPVTLRVELLLWFFVRTQWKGSVCESIVASSSHLFATINHSNFDIQFVTYRHYLWHASSCRPQL